MGRGVWTWLCENVLYGRNSSIYMHPGFPKSLFVGVTVGLHDYHTIPSDLQWQLWDSVTVPAVPTSRHDRAVGWLEAGKVRITRKTWTLAYTRKYKESGNKNKVHANEESRLTYYNVKTGLIDLVGLCWLKIIKLKKRLGQLLLGWVLTIGFWVTSWLHSSLIGLPFM